MIRVDWVGQADAAHVETDQPGKRREPAPHVREMRLVVIRVDRDGVPAGVYEIDRALTDDRVRDVQSSEVFAYPLRATITP